MKRALFLILIVLAASIPISSCLSPQVDEAALFAPAAAAWPAVEVDYLRGVDKRVELGEIIVELADAMRAEADRMEEALDSRSRPRLRLISWGNMEPYVELGIQDQLEDGEVGPFVAESLREQLRQFTAAIEKLQGI